MARAECAKVAEDRKAGNRGRVTAGLIHLCALGASAGAFLVVGLTDGFPQWKCRTPSMKSPQTAELSEDRV